ncbi:MAG TPA: hypothetical protein PLJ18_11580 [Niabella sp.]|nr:hypothetical protein [Bacteroidia bacterium]HOZ91465.1 hypothetical protein [Bacteroidia bacterium]HRB52076.1 hypothetical protein [Bacteroidia bacterium]HRC03087.1 hypothetical protein [Niabella sp.]
MQYNLNFLYESGEILVANVSGKKSQMLAVIKADNSIEYIKQNLPTKVKNQIELEANNRVNY